MKKKQFFGGSNLALQDISDRFTDVFGTTKGRLLSDEYGEYWTGSCFGMAVTSLLFNKQYLDTDTYLENENSVYELSAPRSKDKALSKLILNYQVSQFSENIMDSKSSNKIQTRYSNGDISEICSAVMNLEDEPILLSVWSDTLDKNNPQEHALLPYYAEYAENGIYYVYVYDCNLPPQNEDDIHILTLNESDNTFIYYDDSNFITYDYAISFISLKKYFEELYGDDDVALFESVDADEKFILSLNSNDVTVYNSDGIEANDINEAVLYSANDFELDNITTWLLPSGTYTIINNDTSLEDFRISTASNDDYYSISFSDSAVTAEIGVSAVTDRLYCCGQSYESSDIEITAYNSDKKENSLTLTSDYAYITSCNDKSIMLSTNSEYACINGNYIQLSGNIDDIDYGSGSYLVSVAPKFLNNEAHNCEISVLSEPKALGDNITGTLKLRISNNGNISETGNLIICLYDGTGTAVDVEMYKDICIDTNVYVTESFDMEIYGLDSDVEYMMKIFFWNDNQIPLSNAAELYY